MLHTAEGYRWFVANVILKECAVTVVEDDTGIVSFLALQGEEVRLLYTRPDRIGLEAGTLVFYPGCSRTGGFVLSAGTDDEPPAFHIVDDKA